MFASKKSLKISGTTDRKSTIGFLKRIRHTINRAKNDKSIYYSKRDMLTSLGDDQGVIMNGFGTCRKDLDGESTNNLALMKGESSSNENAEYMNVNEITCDSSEIYATANEDGDLLEERHMVVSHYGAINTPREKDNNENEADYEKQGARPKGKPPQINCSVNENVYSSTHINSLSNQELNASKAWVKGLSNVTENEPQQLCPPTSITNYKQGSISCQRSSTSNVFVSHIKIKKNQNPDDRMEETVAHDDLSPQLATPEMDCETDSLKEITNESMSKITEVDHDNTGNVLPILIKRSSRGDVDEKCTNTPFIAEILTEEDVRLELALEKQFKSRSGIEYIDNNIEKDNMVSGKLEDCGEVRSVRDEDALDTNAISFKDDDKSEEMRVDHLLEPPKIDRKTKPTLTRVRSCQAAMSCSDPVPPSPPPPVPPRLSFLDFDMLHDIDDMDSDDDTHVTMEHFLEGSDTARKTKSLPRPPGLTSDSKDSLKSSTMPFKTRFSQIFRFKRPSVINGKRQSVRPLPDIPTEKVPDISEQTNRPNCYLPIQPKDLSSLPENQDDDNDVPPELPERDAIVNDEAEKSRAEFTSSLRKISDRGWYWGPMSWDDAESRLENTPDGSFLVRDSSDDRHILSLSFRAQSTTHHTRIEHHNGKFSFWSQPTSHGSASIVEFIEEAMQHSRNGRYLYFLRPRLPGFPPAPVQLLYQISRFQKARSLQHMCRFVIRKHARLDHIDLLPLPRRLKDYLKEGQYYTPDDILKDI
ncbi:uncharacterized protein [Antedon mediterranea]|uniref:uncharacterized protein n=1 Tax=Antedon mediterranea TaxID=105859 RepID=UPI003AF74BF2